MKYELVAHYDNDKVLAELWWDGKKVRSSRTGILNHLASEANADIHNEEGFFDAVKRHLRAGYVSLRKKNE